MKKLGFLVVLVGIVALLCAIHLLTEGPLKTANAVEIQGITTSESSQPKIPTYCGIEKVGTQNMCVQHYTASTTGTFDLGADGMYISPSVCRTPGQPAITLPTGKPYCAVDNPNQWP